MVPLSVLEKVYGLQFGEAVHAKVRAENDIGWGDYGPSNNDGFNMESTPSQVTDLTHGKITDTLIELNWHNMATPAETGGNPVDKYELQMKVNDEKWAPLGTTKAAETAFAKKDATPSTVYTF